MRCVHVTTKTSSYISLLIQLEEEDCAFRHGVCGCRNLPQFELDAVSSLYAVTPTSCTVCSRFYSENDITDVIENTFSVEDDKFGEIVTTDLKPGGRDIPVTEDNKPEYVECVAFCLRVAKPLLIIIVGSSRNGAFSAALKTSSNLS